MKATSIYTGNDGESHFKEIEIPLDKNLGTSKISEMMKARDFYFIDCTGEHNTPRHTAPSRLMFLMMRGELEIEVGDGTKHRFGTGDIFVAEDTTGKGHISRAKNRKALVIRLD